MRAKHRFKGYFISSLFMLSIMLLGVTCIDTVNAVWTENLKIDSDFQTDDESMEEGWIRTRASGESESLPYIDDGLFCYDRSGAYISLSGLPSNYTVQISFFISSLAPNQGGTSTLFRVVSYPSLSSTFEVRSQVYGVGDNLNIDGYADAIEDRTYLANITVTSHRAVTMTLWHWYTGEISCYSSYTNSASRQINDGQPHYLIVGDHGMFGSPSTCGPGIYINWYKLSYMEDVEAVYEPDKPGWTDISTNVNTVIDLVIFFLPIMVLTFILGRPGFMLGTGLMSVIWMFNDVSFIWAGVMMLGGIGIFALRGGMK